MVARPAEATKASSFAVLPRRNNQNRMAIGVGMVTHALRAGLTLLRSADGAQVAALGDQGPLSPHIWSDFDAIIAAPPLLAPHLAFDNAHSPLKVCLSPMRLA